MAPAPSLHRDLGVTDRPSRLLHIISSQPWVLPCESMDERMGANSIRVEQATASRRPFIQLAKFPYF
jgi:hypothetical protein